MVLRTEFSGERNCLRNSLWHDGDKKRYENTSIFSKVIGGYIPHGHTSILPHIYIIL